VYRSHAIHSFVLTTFKRIADDMAIFFPSNDQWHAGFDYITQPYAENGAVVSKWNDERSLQAFMGGEVLDAVETALKRIYSLNFSKDIIVDNQIFYGNQSFRDNLNRYRRLGEVERRAVLAGLEGWAGRLAFGRAYSAEGSIELAKQLGQLYGWDGFLFSKVEGVSQKRRHDVIMKAEFAGFGVLNAEDGAMQMQRAFKHIHEAVYRSAEVWEWMKGRPDDAVYPIRTFTAGPSRVERGDDRFKYLRALVTYDNAPLHSHITNKVVLVNMVSFYTTNQPKDLKAFLASGYEGNPDNEKDEWIDKTIDLGNGKTATEPYRNYWAGRPNAWDVSLYHQYFPNVRTQKVGDTYPGNDDIRTTAQILSQTWGSFGVVLPLLQMMD